MNSYGDGKTPYSGKDYPVHSNAPFDIYNSEITSLKQQIENRDSTIKCLKEEIENLKKNESILTENACEFKEMISDFLEMNLWRLPDK